MAFSKADRFNPVIYHQSFWSRALSHPARIIILTHLLKNGRTSFAILKNKIPLARTTVCQHLRILRVADLISADDVYPHTFYDLNPDLCSILAEKIESLNNSFIRKKG